METTEALDIMQEAIIALGKTTTEYVKKDSVTKGEAILLGQLQTLNSVVIIIAKNVAAIKAMAKS